MNSRQQSSGQERKSTSRWRADRRAIWCALALVAVVLGEAPADTQGGPPVVPAFQESGLRPATPVFSQFPFETIDMINRNVMLRFVDLHLPGNGGFDLTFVRVHNSRDGIWRFGIEQAPLWMKPVGGGEECAFASRFAFQWADGSAEQSDCDHGPDELTTSRYGLYKKSESKLRLPNGLVATYGVGAIPGGGQTWPWLTHLEDSFGNGVDFTWAVVEEGGQYRTKLTTVTQYLGSGQQRGVALVNIDPMSLGYVGSESSISFGNQTWRYFYQPDPSHPLQRLVEARPVEGASWLFDYVILGLPPQAGNFAAAVSNVTTPNGGSIGYAYEHEASSSYGCSCDHIAVTNRTMNDGVQTATWTFDSDHLVSQPFSRVNNPDGTRITYTFENRTAGGFFKAVVPLGRVVVRLSNGATLETESYQHLMLQNGIHYTPVLTQRVLSRCLIHRNVGRCLG